MIIVGCQTCGEVKVLAGTPDVDGVARVRWSCARCGTGQVLQLDVTADATAKGLADLAGGLPPFSKKGTRQQLEIELELPELS